MSEAFRLYELEKILFMPIINAKLAWQTFGRHCSLETKESARLSAVSMRQTDLIEILSNIYSYRNRKSAYSADLCGGVSLTAFESTVLYVNAWRNHNLLTCNHAQYSGSILSVDVYPSRKLSAAPPFMLERLNYGRWGFN